jgi:hypothetical protein
MLFGLRLGFLGSIGLKFTTAGVAQDRIPHWDLAVFIVPVLHYGFGFLMIQVCENSPNFADSFTQIFYKRGPVAFYA